MVVFYLQEAELLHGSEANRSQDKRTQVQSLILRPKEIIKYLIITFLILVANSATFIFINPLILSSGHELSFVSIALLINGVAGVIGTSLGGIFADKLTSKRWLIIAISVFIMMMVILNFVLSGTVVLLIGLFV